MKTNSRFNGINLESYNKMAKSPLTYVTTVNGREYWEGEKKPGYYRPVVIARDGVVKQGYWFSESEDVLQFVATLQKRRDDRKNARKAVMASDCGVQVGDIFSCWWGYDETHVDYVKVVAINGRRAVFEDMTGTPGFHNVEDRKTKVIQGTSENPYISLTTYANAYKTTLEEAKRKREQNDVAYTGHYR